MPLIGKVLSFSAHINRTLTALPFQPLSKNDVSPHLTGARVYKAPDQPLWVAALSPVAQDLQDRSLMRHLPYAMFVSGDGRNFQGGQVVGIRSDAESGLHLPVNGEVTADFLGLGCASFIFRQNRLFEMALQATVGENPIRPFLEEDSAFLINAIFSVLNPAILLPFTPFDVENENRPISMAPFISHTVRPIERRMPSERAALMREKQYNVFSISSEEVTIDLLTDSGTGARSHHQLAADITGDESYAGSSSWRSLEATVRNITGLPNILPVHQGRAAEDILATIMIREGSIVPGNSHFDTTKAHIESNKGYALDLTIAESGDPQNLHPFKGDIDIDALENFLAKTDPEKIPFLLITVTCNTAGGQPVSLKNITQTKDVCARYGIKVFLDMARYAENAYFIKIREPEYVSWSIDAIVKEMFRGVSGALMSAKKDGLTPMGGFLAVSEDELYRKARVWGTLREGFPQYGGMSGGTMASLAIGLKEALNLDYLEARVSQVARFGAMLKAYGVPVLEPFGGHAVYVDALRFAPHLPRLEFPAQAIVAAAYILGGVRGVEIGTAMADRDPITREERPPKLELVRLAIPRRVYTDQHLAYVARVFGELFQMKDKIQGLKIIFEEPILRHFTARFETVGEGELILL